MNRRQSHRGFTLIELLLIITLMGILGAMAALSSRGIVDNYKAKGAARQIYGDMQMARLKAIKESKPYSVLFVGSTYTLSNAGDNGIWGDSDDVIAKTVDLVSDYSVATVVTTLTDSRAIFYPNGTGKEDGTVTVTRGAKSVVIRTYQYTGHIRIE